MKIEKNRPYNGLPVVLVFKTSNRSNAKIKMKIWNNQNVDYILSLEEIPGIPAAAEILEVGVGNNLIRKYKQKYNIQ
jgi:hypothetical protein